MLDHCHRLLRIDVAVGLDHAKQQAVGIGAATAPGAGEGGQVVAEQVVGTKRVRGVRPGVVDRFLVCDLDQRHAALCLLDDADPVDVQVIGLGGSGGATNRVPGVV